MPKIRGANIADHKRRTVQGLHDAGAALFVEFGFAAVTLGAIADRAGIARTTVYEYYPSKEALLIDVVKRRVPVLMQNLVDGLTSTHPGERIEELFRACVDHARSDPDTAHLLFRIGRELPKAERDEVWASFGPVTTEIGRIVEAGVASGELPGSDPEMTRRIVADHLVGAIDHMTHTRGDDLAHRELIEARVKFLRSGLTT